MTLISVLIVGAMGAAIVLALFSSGIGLSRSSVSLERARKARIFADACAEEALERIRDFTPFAGSSALSFSGQGSCGYSVANQGGQMRLITASGTADTMVRKVRVAIDKISPQINTVSWQEVADF